LNGITAPISITGGTSYGDLYPFASNPATMLMTGTGGQATVAVRSLGMGRVVHIASAPTYVAGTLKLAPLQLLIGNAILWDN
jgi:hypothetical protein